MVTRNFVPDEQFEKIANKVIGTFIALFTTRQTAVMGYRMGLYDGKLHTLEETAKLFGVTRERIRQIENKSLEQIKSVYAEEIEEETNL